MFNKLLRRMYLLNVLIYW